MAQLFYLKIVLNGNESAGLKLNLSKFLCRKTQLSFLGHIISQDRPLFDPEHVKAVTQTSAPTIFQTLYTLLGLWDG